MLNIASVASAATQPCGAVDLLPALQPSLLRLPEGGLSSAEAALKTKLSSRSAFWR